MESKAMTPLEIAFLVTAWLACGPVIVWIDGRRPKTPYQIAMCAVIGAPLAMLALVVYVAQSVRKILRRAARDNISAREKE